MYYAHHPSHYNYSLLHHLNYVVYFTPKRLRLFRWWDHSLVCWVFFLQWWYYRHSQNMLNILTIIKIQYKLRNCSQGGNNHWNCLPYVLLLICYFFILHLTDYLLPYVECKVLLISQWELSLLLILPYFGRVLCIFMLITFIYVTWDKYFYSFNVY